MIKRAIERLLILRADPPKPSTEPPPNPAGGGAPAPAPANAPPAPATEPPKPGEAAPNPGESDPPKPEPPKSGKDDPLLAALFKDIKDEPEIKKVLENPPAPAPAPAAAPAATPKPGEASPSAQPPKRKKKVSLVDSLDNPQPPPPSPAAPAPQLEPVRPAAPTTPAADPDESYIAGLTDEQKDELADADVAARMFPEKYGQRRKELLGFYRKLDETGARMLTENPEAKLDESNEDWRKFLATKPRMNAAHTKAVQRKIGADQAVSEVRQQMEPELQEVKRRQAEIDYKPKLDSIVQEVEHGLQDMVEGDKDSELGKALRAVNTQPVWDGKEWKVGEQAFPSKEAAEAAQRENGSAYNLERTIFKEEQQKAANMTREYLLFAQGLRRYDANNATHRELLKFVETQEQALLQAGVSKPEVLMQGGKRFVTRSEYNRLYQQDPEGTQRKHWRLGHRDVVEMLAYDAKDRMDRRLKEGIKTAERMGFVRAPKKNSATAPNPQPPPQPLNPPRATPSPAPGAATTPPVTAPAGSSLDGNFLVSALSLRR